MNPLNSNCIIDWEVYHLVNNTQSKFTNAVKLKLKKDKLKEKKKRYRNQNRLKSE